ncbi:hypothetical protein NPIL_156531 [Nephila pilipes]|uniref:Uncharacterized protein n=1 Tax=Nephila pilipes TaxID=299642 RepID=A0A8X6MYM0_NEPPI|nr:hypothetical protein NPIL_156531 [Nephila pilipes]
MLFQHLESGTSHMVVEMQTRRFRMLGVPGLTLHKKMFSPVENYSLIFSVGLLVSGFKGCWDSSAGEMTLMLRY